MTRGSIPDPRPRGNRRTRPGTTAPAAVLRAGPGHGSLAACRFSRFGRRPAARLSAWRRYARSRPWRGADPATRRRRRATDRGSSRSCPAGRRRSSRSGSGTASSGGRASATFRRRPRRSRSWATSSPRTRTRSPRYGPRTRCWAARTRRRRRCCARSGARSSRGARRPRRTCWPSRTRWASCFRGERTASQMLERGGGRRWRRFLTQSAQRSLPRLVSRQASRVLNLTRRAQRTQRGSLWWSRMLRGGSGRRSRRARGPISTSCCARRGSPTRSPGSRGIRRSIRTASPRSRRTC